MRGTGHGSPEGLHPRAAKSKVSSRRKLRAKCFVTSVRCSGVLNYRLVSNVYLSRVYILYLGQAHRNVGRVSRERMLSKRNASGGKLSGPHDACYDRGVHQRFFLWFHDLGAQDLPQKTLLDACYDRGTSNFRLKQCLNDGAP